MATTTTCVSFQSLERKDPSSGSKRFAPLRRRRSRWLGAHSKTRQQIGWHGAGCGAKVDGTKELRSAMYSPATPGPRHRHRSRPSLHELCVTTLGEERSNFPHPPGESAVAPRCLSAMHGRRERDRFPRVATHWSTPPAAPDSKVQSHPRTVSTVQNRWSPGSRRSWSPTPSVP